VRDRPASTIEILYDGDDITSHVLPAETSFEGVASGVPGGATITCKDRFQALSFVTGKDVRLIVDGVTLWGGIVTNVGRRHFFPVVDSTTPSSVRDRKWVLQCLDYNIWFDKRVLNDPTNYLRRLHEPGGSLGHIVKFLFDNYVDEIPGLTFDGVSLYDRHYPKGLFVGQGKLLRDQMEDLAQYGGANWYISPERDLVFQSYAQSVWGGSGASKTFVDSHPNWIRSVGFRDGEINQDGFQLVTDALVWGGAEQLASDDPNTPSGTFFARYPDAPANRQVLPAVPGLAANSQHPAFPAIPEQVLTKEKEQEALDRQALYGRWQRAEMRPGEQGYFDQDDVTGRAYTIVAGPPGIDTATGIDGGLNQPLWQVKLGWFAHDIPNQDHIKPGAIVSFIFYTMGLSLSLPCRRYVISFPGLDPDGKGYVRFDGEFGISYTDSRFLWKYLLRRLRRSRNIKTVITNSSTSSGYGDQGEFSPLESPNGSRVDFTLPFPYLSGTTQVYLNSLRLRRNYDYSERAPAGGLIRFATAPDSTDVIFVICKTGTSG